jgi:hypothetical protein
LVHAFLKKWWVESDSIAPILPLSLRLKVKWFRIIIIKQKDPYINTRSRDDGRDDIENVIY